MSVSRHCAFYKANDGKWYMELADHEYGERSDAFAYGPFDSEEAANTYLQDGFANPGLSWSDDSGTQPPPTTAPNGTPLQTPQRRMRW